MVLLFTPHAEYAEDQHDAHAILTTHVAHRALTITPLISLPLNLGLRAYSRKHFPSATPTTIPFEPDIARATGFRGVNVSVSSTPFLLSLARTTGIISVAVLGGMELALLRRMRGRDEVEWQDRSWRLLGNRGQQEMDMWGYAGAGVGGVGWAVWMAVRPARWAGWIAGFGALGLGNFAGCVGEMGWRGVVKGGVWEDGERVH